MNRSPEQVEGANTPPPGPSEAVMKPAPVYFQVGAMDDGRPEQPERVGRVPQRTHRWVQRLMDGEGRGVLGLLWRLLGREEDVLDAYQDCFCRLATVAHPGRLRVAKAYLYRTASNIAIEMLRSRRRRQALWPRVVERQNRVRDAAEAMPDDDTLFPAVMDSSTLREAIESLPNHLRQVIVLRDLTRWSYAEVGRALGIEPATARVYRRHAIVKLAEHLGRSVGEPQHHEESSNERT